MTEPKIRKKRKLNKKKGDSDAAEICVEPLDKRSPNDIEQAIKSKIAEQVKLIKEITSPTKKEQKLPNEKKKKVKEVKEVKELKEPLVMKKYSSCLITIKTSPIIREILK